MPNHFFRFKQFTIYQDRCAMKVCTDACLFGGWVADILPSLFNNTQIRVLDIGTGTGLLSLMLAQKSTAQIDAVEMDKDAAKQAGDNFVASPWHERLYLYPLSIQQFQQTGYACIISNPPFYEWDLKSPDQQRNLAHHSAALSLQELWQQCDRLLANNGLFAVLLPAQRLQDCLNLATQQGFYLHQQVMVQQTPHHPPFRCMLLFGRTPAPLVTASITIKAHDQYTESFRRLLGDYYLQ